MSSSASGNEAREPREEGTVQDGFESTINKIVGKESSFSNQGRELVSQTVETDSILANPVPANSIDSDKIGIESVSSELISIPEFWARSLTNLRRELDPQVFSAFIEPLKLAGYDDSQAEVTVSAPSRFLCNHVDVHFRGRITDVLCHEIGLENLQLRFVVETQTVGDQASSTTRAPIVVVKKLRKPTDDSRTLDANAQRSSGINPRYTFNNFVVGNSNQFCHAAAMRVAEEPGKSYNPLFIYGGVGLGKTHILHAIGNAVLERNPRSRVLYMSSESFTNELIQALRHAKMDEFKNKFRNIEVLLIDDIQFMCGKERTQEEFFHTFNALYNSKHQIVITSDKIPQEIPGIEERLQTRFSWGLTADIQAPDFETRVAIVNRKASLEMIDLPQEVSHLIADKISSNVRELEGALTRLQAVSSLSRTPITLSLAETALKPLLQPKVVSLSVDDIKKAVAGHFGLKVSDLISKRRTKNLSFPRHIAMYLCRKHTTCSYPEIGGQFGGRDHSSVIHAAHVVSSKVRTDTSSRELISTIEKRLLG